MSHRARILVVVPLVAAAAACAGDDDGVAEPVGETTTTFMVDEPTETIGTPEVDIDVDLEDRLGRAGEALAQGDFTTLLTALELSGILDQLETQQATLLAPTDTAFAQLSTDDLSDLLTSASQIEEVLRRHVIDESLTWEQLQERSEVTTLSGDILPVAVDGDQVTVGGAAVSEPGVTNIEEQDLAVYVIDRVLL